MGIWVAHGEGRFTFPNKSDFVRRTLLRRGGEL